MGEQIKINFDNSKSDKEKLEVEKSLEERRVELAKKHKTTPANIRFENEGTKYTVGYMSPEDWDADLKDRIPKRGIDF